MVGAGVVAVLEAAVEDGGDLLGETIDDLEPVDDGGGHGSIEVGAPVVTSLQ